LRKSNDDDDDDDDDMCGIKIDCFFFQMPSVPHQTHLPANPVAYNWCLGSIVKFCARKKEISTAVQMSLNILTYAGSSIRASSRRNSPAIPHELTAYLVEKLPHILRLTRETFATKHEPWISQDLFRKNKRILPTF